MLEENLNTSQAVDNIKGTVTVELFDAKTGKLVEKQENHNFIANHGKEYLRYLQRTNFKNQISTLNAASDTDYAVPSVFTNILLTDSVQAEDPATEWSFPGKITGYATKETYSGANTLRGTPNAGLSETTQTHTKWVFDWPTHAANGTIGSVSWNSNPDITESRLYFPTDIRKSTTATSIKQVPLTNRPIAYVNDNLLFAGTNTTVTKYDANMDQQASFTTISIRGIAWDSSNNKLWVISNNQIASYSENGTLIDAPVSVTDRQYRGLTFDGTTLWTTVSVSNTDWHVHRLNTSGGDVSEFNAYPGAISPGTANVCDIAYDIERSLLYILGRGVYDGSGQLACSVFNLSGQSTGTFISMQPFYQGNRGYYYQGDISTSYFDYSGNSTLRLITTHGSNTNVPYYPYPTGTMVQTLRIDGMGSRALLPSPITKTDQQSLRITYRMDYS